MEKRAQARFVRISPRKARIVIDAIRGKMVDQALDQLRFTNRSSARPIEKLLRSAVANMRNADSTLDERSLVVSRCWVDQGPSISRWRPRAYGRATRIDKFTSHINLVLSDEVS
jgi:large subunit ribosomal protein L22